MKAPDKIYLTTSAENEKHGNNWGCWTDRECPGETYIRKGALMEWAKQKQLDSLTIVQDNFWQEVIDKLNSM